jgi:hypothetical protein
VSADLTASFQGRQFVNLDWEGGFYSAYGSYRLTSVEGTPCVHARCPSCGNGLMLGPKPPASGHSFRINDDGTVTCELHPREDPDNSNSILCPCGWHGQLIAGFWKPI